MTHFKRMKRFTRMKHFTKALAVMLCTTAGGMGHATSLPAVNGSYEGNYTLENVFDGHGLYLVNLFRGYDRSWSIQNGVSNFDAGVLDISGRVENSGSLGTLNLDFNFRLFENASHAGNLQCQTNCGSPSADALAGITFFDMGANAVMGSITGVAGTLTDGLELSVVMNSPNANAPDPIEPKLGQLGYGGNWLDSSFGYSNWFNYSVVSSTLNGPTTNGGSSGDINVNFLAPPSPVPLPAGIPLLLTGLASLLWVRRKTKTI